MPEYIVKAKQIPHVSQKEAEAMAAQAAEEQAAIEAAQAKQQEEDNDLLDEIDSMIEENEVLVNFRQQGGQ